jgi:cytochrome c-type biogenesis protein CcmH/NrfF
MQALRAAIVAVSLVVASVGAGAPMAATLNRPSGIAEMELMHGLACTCAACQREALDECKCDNAAEMRGVVKAQLVGRDLSTEAARTTAIAAVRAKMAGIYGAEVLAPGTPRATDARITWLPVIVFVGGLGLLLVVTRRSLARRRAQKAGPPRA